MPLYTGLSSSKNSIAQSQTTLARAMSASESAVPSRHERHFLYESGGYSGNRSTATPNNLQEQSSQSAEFTDLSSTALTVKDKSVTFAVEVEQIPFGATPSRSGRPDRVPIPIPYRSSRPPIPTPSEPAFGSRARPSFSVAGNSGRVRTSGLPALLGHRTSPTASQRQSAVTEGASSSTSDLLPRPVPVRIGHYLPSPPCFPDPPFPSPSHPTPRRAGSHLPHPLGFPVPGYPGEIPPRFNYTNPLLEQQGESRLLYQSSLEEVESQTHPPLDPKKLSAALDASTRSSQPSEVSQRVCVQHPRSASIELSDPYIPCASYPTEAFPLFNEESKRLADFGAKSAAYSISANTTRIPYSTGLHTTEPLPNLEKEEIHRTPAESFKYITGDNESDLSPIGSRVAQSRLRSSSSSSDSSLVTVVHSPDSDTPSTRPSTASTTETNNSFEKRAGGCIPDYLRNPIVFIVELPENHYKLLEDLVTTNSELSEVRPPLFPDTDSSSYKDSQSQEDSEYIGREGARSRLGHVDARGVCLRSRSSSSSEESAFSAKERFKQLFPELATSQDLKKLKNRVRAHRRSDSQTSASSSSSEPNSNTPSGHLDYRAVASPNRPKSPTPILKYNKDYEYLDMSYQNYVDQPSGGSGPNPRQAPPSPSQGAQHANGMNGGMGMGGAMVGYPTPAGHQSDLNMIMQMVEEFSGLLQNNQRLTAGVVEKIGKVREKAQHHNLSNDDLIQVVAAELNEDSKNLEKENSELRKALDKAEYDKKENFKLACHGANILADITEKMHAFKEQHEADTLAWHRNYRKQLADEREENLQLRNQINDMMAAAARANGHLRDMRKWLTDHDELNELRIQNTQLRQERRFWKRLALPLIPDNDPEWSDDDDLIDPEEKKRQDANEAEKKRKENEDAEGGGGGGGDSAGA